MRINNIQIYNPNFSVNRVQPKKKPLTFGAYYDFDQKVKQNYGDGKTFQKCNIHNYTCLFRDPKLFRDLPSIIEERFPNGVKIYDYACSVGYEPLSILLTMHNKIPEDKISKYLPIEAIDNNAEAIKFAQKYSLRLEPDEKRRLNENTTNINKSDYVEIPRCLCRLTKKAQDEIHFQVGNLYKDLCNNKFKGEPCVILFRNVWQYMTPKGINKFADKLYQKLPPGSMLIIGDCDIWGADIDEALEKRGFKQLEDIDMDKCVLTDDPAGAYCFVKD